jgi:predicted MFS family arabinose efflux permease
VQLSEQATLNSPHALAAAIYLTVTAFATFLVLPLFVGAAAESLGLNQQEVGFMASAVASGAVISSLAMIFIVRRLPWRTTAVTALCLMLLSMTASLYTEDAGVFMVLQGVAALGGGAVYSLALTALSDRTYADRGFGLSIAAQVGFQVVGMLALPQLLGAAGFDGMLGLFIAMELFGLLAVVWLPKSGRVLPAQRAEGSIFTAPVMLSLGGCFFFFFNVGAVWTYLERMAVLSEFDPQSIGNGLAIGVFMGIPGALLASWCGDRFGRVGPLALGTAGTVLAVMLLGSGMQYATFVAAVALYNFVWNFSLAFQYSAVNAVDSSGSGVAAAPAFHGAGVAVGPAVAALYVTQDNLAAVNVVAAVGVLVSLLLFVMADGLVRRHR